MIKERFQKLAGIIAEDKSTEGVPLNSVPNIMNLRVMYVGKLFEFDPLADTSIRKINDRRYGESYIFESLGDFLTIIRSSSDLPDSEIQKYIKSLKVLRENNAIVTRYSNESRPSNAIKLHNQYLELKIMKTKGGDF
jgi:hypothetical protein